VRPLQPEREEWKLTKKGKKTKKTINTKQKDRKETRRYVMYFQSTLGWPGPKPTIFSYNGAFCKQKYCLLL
jgi:hypothetical protein